MSNASDPHLFVGPPNRMDRLEDQPASALNHLKGSVRWLL